MEEMLSNYYQIKKNEKNEGRYCYITNLFHAYFAWLVSYFGDSNYETIQSDTDNYIDIKLTAVKYLTNNGADINEQDNLGTTPLMHCLLNEEFKAIDLLLEFGRRMELLLTKKNHGQSLHKKLFQATKWFNMIHISL